MAGDTTTIDMQTLHVHWSSGSTILQICTHWTIGRDQLARLVRINDWPLRMDRSKRRRAGLAAKPERDPTPDEIAAMASAIKERHFAAMRAQKTPTGKPTNGGRMIRLDVSMRRVIDDHNRYST